MIIKSATIEAIRTQFGKVFQRAIASAPEHWKRVATLVPSGSAENTYGWLGKFPALREWVGERLLRSVKEHAYTITNKKFESTVDVDRADIEDDNLGVYTPLVRSLGEEVMAQIDREIFGLLGAGFANLCYDGQNFFDTDHPVNAAVDGKGANTPTSNLLDPAPGAGGKIDRKTPWYLLNTKRSLKPLIFQERTKPELETVTDTRNDTVFMKDKYLYGARVRRAFGYGFWQMAVAARVDLTEKNLNTAMKTMMEFKADGGDPLGMMPDLLVVPPALRAAANEAVLAERKANGASNPNYKAVDVLITPWLA